MPDKRQYVRMNTVFPVEVEIYARTGEKKSSTMLQGFTRDVSAGGMCIELKSFGKHTEELLLLQDTHLELTINPPFSAQPIRAWARVVWRRKDEFGDPPRLLLGASYTHIDESAKNRIIGHAKRLVWFPRVVALALASLVAFAAYALYNEQRVSGENRKLVNELIQNAEKKSGIASNLYQLQRRKTQLDSELAAARKKIKTLEASLATAQAADAERLKLSEELAASRAREEKLDAEIDTVAEGKAKLLAVYQTLQDSLSSKPVPDQMAAWLSSHQNLKTGLVASYEGDPALEDWAFTYDQSLACQAFLLYGQKAAAAKILDFYDHNATRDRGGFFNAYHAADGRPTENLVRVGPNIWIGIAALRYEKQVGDGRFLRLARRVGDWTIGYQDEEGGVRGGPDAAWYGTEHNLDAYAFLRMLGAQTGEAKYTEAAEHTLAWIRKYAYSVKEKRLRRGKGDSTISTDTFSWAIAAIGPARLSQIEFDPEAIVDFAEKNCAITVDVRRSDQKTSRATGFDFAKAENIGRGGVVSTEWTAQMIVTYRILVGYFEKLGHAERATLYRDKAEFYLNELQKLMITSPSRTGQGRGCLPYASADNVDTGHGWRTPKGQRTGSVAGTAYGIFAWKGYNPLDADVHVEG